MSVLYRHATGNYYVHHVRDNVPRIEDFPLQVHDMHEFYYFISGRGKFLIESSTYQLFPGCIVLIRAGETHRLQINTDVPYERIDIEFSPSLLADIDPQNALLSAFTDRAAGQSNMYTPDMINVDLVRACMNTLSSQSRIATENRRPLILMSCLSPVLLEINRAFNDNKNKTPPQKEGVITVVSQLMDYINTHLCEDFSLDDLSERFYFSKTHLNNQFKQATGATIGEYTIMKRLTLARQYIYDGMSVGSAAVASGWNDYSSFYRRYKARFGVSPIVDRPNKTVKLNQI